MDSNINHSIHRQKRSSIPMDMELLKTGVLTGDLLSISKAITVAENHNLRYTSRILSFLADLPEKTKTLRIAITGPPGAGKSTFIEAIGMEFIHAGLKVAVMAIDPASETSRGSILGDKTRMTKLSQSPQAFIRPSSNILESGGIRSSSFHTIRICEAAGYDIILVETVGVGQSEIRASKITDITFLILTPTGGDELQGIKKGIVEKADYVLVNKADGINKAAATATARHYKNASHMQKKKDVPRSSTHIKTISAIEGDGIKDLADEVYTYLIDEEKRNYIKNERLKQKKEWLEEEAKAALMFHLLANENIQSSLAELTGTDMSLKKLVEFNKTIAQQIKKL